MAEEGDWGKFGDDDYEEDPSSPTTTLPKQEKNDKLNELAVPGDCIADSVSFAAGPGTYKYYDKIYASIVGTVFREGDIISVRDRAGSERDVKTINPSSGSSVIARVVRVNPRHVICDILSIDEVPLKLPCRGQIRASDLTEGVTVLSVYDQYRPGDIIRACIITAGLAKSVLLTTQAKEYGVILAECKSSGKHMKPVASNLMQCAESKAYEFRKVASLSNHGE